MDYYHSIVWPMVSYHWKTIVCNGLWSCWKTIVTIPSFDHRKKLKNHQTQLYMGKNHRPFQRAKKIDHRFGLLELKLLALLSIPIFKGCSRERVRVSLSVCVTTYCARRRWNGGDHIIRTQLARGEDTAEGHTSYLSFFSTYAIFGSIFLHIKVRESWQNIFRDKTA